MQTPIIIVELDSDVDLYDSLEFAESDLEPADAKSGEFRAFDARGVELEIQTIDLGWLKGERVKFSEPTESAPTATDYLCPVMKRYLLNIGADPKSLENVNLPTLIALLQEFCQGNPRKEY